MFKKVSYYIVKWNSLSDFQTLWPQTSLEYEAAQKPNLNNNGALILPK